MTGPLSPQGPRTTAALPAPLHRGLGLHPHRISPRGDPATPPPVRGRAWAGLGLPLRAGRLTRARPQRGSVQTPRAPARCLGPSQSLLARWGPLPGVPKVSGLALRVVMGRRGFPVRKAETEREQSMQPTRVRCLAPHRVPWALPGVMPERCWCDPELQNPENDSGGLGERRWEARGLVTDCMRPAPGALGLPADPGTGGCTRPRGAPSEGPAGLTATLPARPPSTGSGAGAAEPPGPGAVLPGQPRPLVGPPGPRPAPASQAPRAGEWAGPCFRGAGGHAPATGHAPDHAPDRACFSGHAHFSVPRPRAKVPPLATPTPGPQTRSALGLARSTLATPTPWATPTPALTPFRLGSRPRGQSLFSGHAHRSPPHLATPPT